MPWQLASVHLLHISQGVISGEEYVWVSGIAANPGVGRWVELKAGRFEDGVTIIDLRNKS